MRAKGTRHRSYAAAVDFLTKHPDKIRAAWEGPFDEQGGSLFVFVTPDGRRDASDFEFLGETSSCCLTQLKSRKCDTIPRLSPKIGANLMSKLRADRRIPSNPERTTVNSLSAFAEWQEQMDKAFGKCVK